VLRDCEKTTSFLVESGTGSTAISSLCQSDITKTSQHAWQCTSWLKGQNGYLSVNSPDLFFNLYSRYLFFVIRRE